MIEDYSEEEMYLREHKSLDERISEAELKWVTNLFDTRLKESEE